MASDTEKTKAKIDEPLYNSKIIKIFVEYVAQYHPKVDINEILKQSWINQYEIEDPGHWFSQWQVDRFYDAIFNEPVLYLAYRREREVGPLSQLDYLCFRVLHDL